MRLYEGRLILVDTGGDVAGRRASFFFFKCVMRLYEGRLILVDTGGGVAGRRAFSPSLPDEARSAAGLARLCNLAHETLYALCRPQDARRCGCVCPDGRRMHAVFTQL
jgi:hypothetical protein